MKKVTIPLILKINKGWAMARHAYLCTKELHPAARFRPYQLQILVCSLILLLKNLVKTKPLLFFWTIYLFQARRRVWVKMNWMHVLRKTSRVCQGTKFWCPLSAWANQTHKKTLRYLAVIVKKVPQAIQQTQTAGLQVLTPHIFISETSCNVSTPSIRFPSTLLPAVGFSLHQQAFTRVLRRQSTLLRDLLLPKAMEALLRLQLSRHGSGRMRRSFLACSVIDLFRVSTIWNSTTAHTPAKGLSLVVSASGASLQRTISGDICRCTPHTSRFGVTYATGLTLTNTIWNGTCWCIPEAKLLDNLTLTLFFCISIFAETEYKCLKMRNDCCFVMEYDKLKKL